MTDLRHRRVYYDRDNVIRVERDYGPPRWRELLRAVPEALVIAAIVIALIVAASGTEYRP